MFRYRERDRRRARLRYRLEFLAPRAIVPAPLVFSRTSGAWLEDGAALQPFAANVPRFRAGRLVVEGLRTNLFLNSAIGATQNVTVTAAVHTLSFVGTGTVTLSGASTAGPLVGTGANARVALTFTPTAGTLTLTVTGDVRRVQLEAGAFASSHIETAGAIVTRLEDRLSVPLAALALPASRAAAFLLSAIMPQAAPAGGERQVCFWIDDGTFNDNVRLYVESGSTSLVVERVTAGAPAPAIVGSITPGTPFRAGIAMDGAGRVAASLNGGAITAVTGAPTTSLTTARVGATTSNIRNLNGDVRALRVLPRAVSDAQLQALVAALPA